MASGAGRQRRLPVAALVVVGLGVLALACGEAEPPPAPPEGEAPPAESAAPEPQEAPPPAPEVPAPQPAPEEAPPPEAIEPPPVEPAPPPLELEELERRLKETRAIGVFTKLALKGDIDDLLAALRAYHDRGEGDLPDLRERFDVLVMKVLSLLQDDEPGLAEALARSRERLWKLLTDPQEFARITA